jgi:hypothetical protein
MRRWIGDQRNTHVIPSAVEEGLNGVLNLPLFRRRKTDPNRAKALFAFFANPDASVIYIRRR